MTALQRSTFVSVVAWVFIVFSGLGVFIMALETLLFFLMPFEELAKQSGQAGEPFSQDIFIGFMRGFVVFMLLVSFWSLASSIGLLLRKNWGRINFIILMVIGIIFQVLGVLWSFAFLFIGAFIPEQAQNGVDVSFMKTFMWVMFAFSLIISIGFGVLYGWIIKKLVSPEIRAEFVAQKAATGVAEL